VAKLVSNSANAQRMEKIVSLCKRRGFIYQASEIYGGLNGVWDYGPLGVELKRNLKEYWWRVMVRERDDVVGMDGAILTHPAVLKASGHVDTFTDPMVDCDVCKRRFRADQLAEPPAFYGLFDIVFLGNNDSHIGQTRLSAGGDSVDDAKRKAKIQATNVQPRETKRLLIELESGKKGNRTPCCTYCGSDLSKSEARPFNLMFQTQIGASSDPASLAYLRPETAQSIFVQFKNVLDTSRQKLPFGIAQIGKAFRNEINPRNYIFRSREFEQMELEYFCRPEQGMELLDYWLEERLRFYKTIGIPRDKLHVLTVPDAERAFYSKGTYDIEYDFPFGRQELEGVAYRTDYDLTQHQNASGKPLDYFDEETKVRFIPHVVEPSAGVDRTVLALLCEAYDEETVTDDKGKSETRIVMRFHPRIAPTKAGIFPLLKNNEQLVAKAREVQALLRPHMNVFYDETGAIGRRYRRQDEAGTPFGLTIDFETLGERDPALRDTVTLRDRDTMKQERVAIAELRDRLLDAIA
jgi:glycyl-tRNA synthetase